MSPNSCHEDSSSNEDLDEKHTRHDSPPLIIPQPSIPQPLTNHPLASPDRLATSSNSPESRDLDVEDEHDTDAPENLSLKKPSSPETPPPVQQPAQNNQNGQINSLHSQIQQQIHQQQAQNTPQTPPFIPYHHFAPQFPHAFQNQTSPGGAPPGLGAPGQYPLQRSPVDILLRVFPGRRRSDVEALLQR